MKHFGKMKFRTIMVLFIAAIVAVKMIMPVQTMAAMNSFSGTMGGVSVGGYISIVDNFATAGTSCEDGNAWVSVSLRYYYVDENSSSVVEVTGYQESHGSISVSCVKPNGNNRSYKAVSSHCVRYNAYCWTPSDAVIYY